MTENSMTEKVLVIDDDTKYLEEMDSLLKEAGYQVETCADPLKANEFLARGPVSCVILDYKMPGLDGQDLLHLIHAKHPEIPVILCSAYLEREGPYFLKEGAFEILSKPFSSRILFDTIQKALAKEEEVTPIFVKGYDLRAARATITRKMIVKALSRSEFNVTHAAKLLGISRQGLIRYMKRFQISH